MGVVVSLTHQGLILVVRCSDPRQQLLKLLLMMLVLIDAVVILENLQRRFLGRFSPRGEGLNEIMNIILVLQDLLNHARADTIFGLKDEA